ncbi:Endonuclease/exonuclease/phosphatase [Marasmius fiardii PR-910]|nr:Endonuclease/exonuclease/phosphatase [Marasmius fiardii PR-910]
MIMQSPPFYTTVSPPRRQIIRRSGTSPSSEQSGTFSVLCYNILCPQYASPTLYHYTPSWALPWQYRRDLIMNEIHLYSCDFVCMQEVDWKIYDEWLRGKMREEGYESVYCPTWVKSLARSKDRREKRDGCAVFWKAEKYGLVEDQLIEFSNLAKKRQDFKSCKAVSNRLLQRGNIAIICLFKCLATQKQLLLTNTHVHWDPEFCDVKLVQVGILLREMEKVVDRVRSEMAQHEAPDLPVVLCGDFNSLPSSGVHEFLSTGMVPRDHPDFKRFQYGWFTKHGMRHNLGLRSAYARRDGQSNEEEELPWTNYTAHFKGVLDYIWYSKDTLESNTILGKIEERYLEAERITGFPHIYFPSDHIPIMTELAWGTSKKGSL